MSCEAELVEVLAVVEVVAAVACVAEPADAKCAVSADAADPENDSPAARAVAINAMRIFMKPRIPFLSFPAESTGDYVDSWGISCTGLSTYRDHRIKGSLFIGCAGIAVVRKRSGRRREYLPARPS
ncbi:hypothetical protein AB0O34_27285 [Sphaerisporangium sp. NPDC088356]|uniref:hypothetical protein n=1 Tax=Sphaerisporangium sp. NPDC088356 TaxID=3154871 RepID=UPI003413807F